MWTSRTPQAGLPGEVWPLQQGRSRRESMLDQTPGVEAREGWKSKVRRQVRHDRVVEQDCHVKAWVLRTSAGTGKSETRDTVEDDDGKSETQGKVKDMDEDGKVGNSGYMERTWQVQGR
jgi:hypothetical protein